MAKNWKEANSKLSELFSDKQICGSIRGMLLNKTVEERMNYFVGDEIEIKTALEMLLPTIKQSAPTIKKITSYKNRFSMKKNGGVVKKKSFGKKEQKSSRKLKITDAFPDGLQYLEPKPLLASIGLDWEYQPDPSLYKILRKELKNHYDYYCQGRIDKGYMPLFLFLSGSGKGKSRNATEFSYAAAECLDKGEDSELRNKIQNALVFNISYENGTNLRQVESDAYKAIGTRMLLQLLCTNMNLDEIISSYEAPFPGEVLSLVAKYKKQDLNELTIFIVVDGLQHIIRKPIKDGIDSEFKFHQVMSNIGDLGCQGAFLIPCVTATITGPINTFLRDSTQRHVFLPVPSLHPPTIYQKNTKKSTEIFQQDYITKILVNDCGGHGRTLEILYKKLINRDINKCNINLLMSNLYFELSEQYVGAFDFTPTEARSIAKVILTQQPLNLYENIPNTNKTPEHLTQLGLIQFERIGPVTSKIGYLTAPYIYIWILAQKIGGDWKKLLKIDSKSQPAEAQFWQNFEHFVTTFRCLKSNVIGEGESTTISEIHAGARLNGDIKFINHHLDLGIANKLEPTDCDHSDCNIGCENGIINIQQGRHCIINHEDAQSGGSFLCLKRPQSKTLNEVHQYKLWKGKKIDQKVYLQERNKAASKNDFFILFTTQNCDEIKLPENSGIVDKGNWTKYFGPFAGRAFIFSTPLDINTANRTFLQQVNNIGPEIAEKIISKRPFTDITNAMEKPGIKSNLLEKFRFPTQKTQKYHSLARASHVIYRNISHFI